MQLQLDVKWLRTGAPCSENSSRTKVGGEMRKLKEYLMQLETIYPPVEEIVMKSSAALSQALMANTYTRKSSGRGGLAFN